MRKLFASIFALMFMVSSVYADGTLTMMGFGSAGVPPTPPSVVFTQQLTSVSGATSHSFSVNTGTAKVGRLIVVAVQLNNATLSSPTIGGVGATIYNQQTGALAMFGAVVPTGTTATVTFTTSATVGDYGGVWAIYDLNSPTPLTATGNAVLGNTSFGLTTQPGGVAIAATVGFRSGGLTVSLGGVTQDYTGTFNANYRQSGGSIITPGTSVTISNAWSAAPTNFPALIGVSWR